MATVKLTTQLIAEYRNGGEGFVKWVEDNIWMPIYKEGTDIATWWPMGDLPTTPNPITGRSYRTMWLQQQEHLIPAFEMVNGRFKHRLIAFCWMRGEGKSAVVCLGQMWKFFNWPKQQIVLGANSKDQTKFVHYDIIREMILNSPNLLEFIGGDANIQEKQISMRPVPGGSAASAIRSISSFSGIVSNITGYTFSEMFDMKNPKFFTQLDGSIRNVPNALGMVDSTVSTKDHVLFKLYEAYTGKKIPELYFSYRCSPLGQYTDFYHPQMTQAQLDAYQEKFPMGEFDRYFKNLWDAGSTRVFSPVDVSAMQYWGVHGQVGNTAVLRAALTAVHNKEEQVRGISQRVEEQSRDRDNKGSVIDHKIVEEGVVTLTDLKKDLYPIEDTYKLVNTAGDNCPIDIAGIQKLSELFDTNFSVHVGLDRADPLALGATTRTILSMVLKGLPGSRTQQGYYAKLDETPPYIYIGAGLVSFKEHELDDLKSTILKWSGAVDGVDTFCAERWGTWDLQQWCVSNGITPELVSPSYERQKTCFSEIYTLVTQYRIKFPPTYVYGSRSTDILLEEMGLFTHDPVKKWFGSPEKHAKGGVQDDAIYSLGWCIYGGRFYKYDNFRKRGRRGTGFLFIPNTDVLGAYT